MTDSNTLHELANNPADAALCQRARELAFGDDELTAKAEALIAQRPTRGQVHALLEELRPGASERQMNGAAVALCAALGNKTPSTSEKLLAIQVRMLQEQGDLLLRLLNETRWAAGQAKGKSVGPSFMNAVIAGFIGGEIARL